MEVADSAGINSQHSIVHNGTHDFRLQQIHQYLSDHKNARDHCIVQILSDILPHKPFSLSVLSVTLFADGIPVTALPVMVDLFQQRK